MQAAINPSNATIAMAQEKIAQASASGKAAQAQLNQAQEKLVQRRTEIESRLISDRHELQQIVTELKPKHPLPTGLRFVHKYFR